MGSGKHASDEEFEFGSVFIIVAIIALIAGVIFGVNALISKLGETKAEEVSSETEQVVTSQYDILGTVSIEKIGISQPILDSVEDKALEEGVIKLYGDTLNGEGNFCIAGHNYDNFFKRFDELEIGDEIKILDANAQTFTYRITEISSVEPTDLTMLRREEGKTQITLITCENYSTKRLIVKAELQNI